MQYILICILVKHIPAWAPGGSFRYTADRWRDWHMQMIEGPYLWAKANQASVRTFTLLDGVRLF